MGGVDYDYDRDSFCLPHVPPASVQLGNNMRAMVYHVQARPAVLNSVTLETLSLEVVVGLLSVSIQKNTALHKQ
jgi:hypothetical protein